MELQQLKYFQTVAEVGKINEAAKLLFISAPALSTSISRLEDELGVRLFDRTNNRITLNQQGQILLRTVKHIISDLERTKLELRQSVLLQGQYVSITSIASTQWVDMVAAFSKEHPDFTLQCTTMTRLSLANRGLSAQHSFLLASDSDIPLFYSEKLDNIFLFEDHPVVMVHRDHPIAQRKSVDLRMLQGEKIFLPMQNMPLYENLVQVFYRCGIPFPAGNAYSHLATEQMVAQGLGVAFATSHTAYTPTLPIRYIPIENEYQPWCCRLYWRKDHALTKDEQLFKSFVANYYAVDHTAMSVEPLA